MIKRTVWNQWHHMQIANFWSVSENTNMVRVDKRGRKYAVDKVSGIGHITWKSSYYSPTARILLWHTVNLNYKILTQNVLQLITLSPWNSFLSMKIFTHIHIPQTIAILFCMKFKIHLTFIHFQKYTETICFSSSLLAG